MPSAYSARCKLKRAAHDSGARKANSIRLVVIHDAEASSAAGVANFFASSSSAASTQLAVDGKECWRMLPDLVVPWGAPGANSDGLHVEICGYAAWSKDEWLQHEHMLRRAAWKAAKWCWLYGISARWLSDKQLANGTARGLTTHRQVSRVMQTPGGHTDPGPNFPAATFLGWVKEYLAEIKADRER